MVGGKNTVNNDSTTAVQNELSRSFAVHPHVSLNVILLMSVYFFLLQHMTCLDFVSHTNEKGSVTFAQSLSAPMGLSTLSQYSIVYSPNLQNDLPVSLVCHNMTRQGEGNRKNGMCLFIYLLIADSASKDLNFKM